MDTNYCLACPSKVRGQPVLVATRVWRCPLCGNVEDYTTSTIERVRALMHMKDQVAERRYYGAWSKSIDWWAIDREIVAVLGMAGAPVG